MPENVGKSNYFLYCFQTKMDSACRADFQVLSGIFVTRKTPIEVKKKEECFLLFGGCNSSPLAENTRKIKMLTQILKRLNKSMG